MTGIICVGLGGGLGAVLRYGISLLPYKGTFPALTLVTNVLGALVIGVIAGMAARKNLSPNLVLFLKTGVCGGFTTFSTFSLEAYTLIGKGHYGMAAVYMCASVIFCLIGVMGGMYVSEHI